MPATCPYCDTAVDDLGQPCPECGYPVDVSAAHASEQEVQDEQLKLRIRILRITGVVLVAAGAAVVLAVKRDSSAWVVGLVVLALGWLLLFSSRAAWVRSKRL